MRQVCVTSAVDDVWLIINGFLLFVLLTACIVCKYVDKAISAAGVLKHCREVDEVDG